MASRRGAFLVLSVALLVLVCHAGVTDAALMALERYALTVAGQLNKVGRTDGFSGTSLFESGAPLAMCAYPSLSSATDDSFLVGDSQLFRTFNRTDNYLGTYGAATFNGVAVTPYACSTVKYSSVATTYYVTNSPMVGYITNTGAQGAVSLGDSGFLSVTVDPLHSYLFALSQQARLYRCSISDVTPIMSCSEISVAGGNWPSGTSNTAGGVVVTTSNIFIATGVSINVYTRDGTYVTSTGLGTAYRDVHAAGGSIYAVSDCVVYNVTLTGNVLATTVISGTTTCGVTSGVNGQFRRLYKVYPINRDAIYLSANTDGVLRSLTVPPMKVAITFPRPPFPLGFGAYEDGTLMDLLYHYMDVDLQAAIGAGTAVDPSSVSVDPSLWVTNMTVEVPQYVFDTALTEDAIRALPFTQTADLLTNYYNRTNELVYGDANLLPLCSARQMRLVEHAVAERAREALKFPHIYTGTYQFPFANAPNASALKLLMPADFGYGNYNYDSYNATTHPLLVNASFSEDFFIDAVRQSTPPERQYVLRLNQPPASVSRLTPEQRVMLRYVVQNMAKKRLDECQRSLGGGGSSGGGNGAGSDSGSGSGAGSGVDGTCTPRVGLTNLTQVGSTNYTYDIFIPDDMNYNFNITLCLDGLDKEVADWINGQPQPSHRKCGTGCIVGIAVAAAVVAAFLVVLIVVLTSKRKRLATVVAPGAASAAEPKFVSSYDDESGNPLDD